MNSSKGQKEKRKKKKEKEILCKFLKCVNLLPSEINESERPDFVCIINNKRIGFEIKRLIWEGFERDSFLFILFQNQANKFLNNNEVIKNNINKKYKDYSITVKFAEINKNVLDNDSLFENLFNYLLQLEFDKSLEQFKINYQKLPLSLKKEKINYILFYKLEKNSNMLLSLQTGGQLIKDKNKNMDMNIEKIIINKINKYLNNILKYEILLDINLILCVYDESIYNIYINSILNFIKRKSEIKNTNLEKIYLFYPNKNKVKLIYEKNNILGIIK